MRGRQGRHRVSGYLMVSVIRRLERSHSEVVPGVGLVVGGVVRLGLASKTTGLTKKLLEATRRTSRILKNS